MKSINTSWLSVLGLALPLHAVEDFQSLLRGANRRLISGLGHSGSSCFKERKFRNLKFSQNPEPATLQCISNEWCAHHICICLLNSIK